MEKEKKSIEEILGPSHRACILYIVFHLILRTFWDQFYQSYFRLGNVRFWESKTTYPNSHMWKVIISGLSDFKIPCIFHLQLCAPFLVHKAFVRVKLSFEFSRIRFLSTMPPWQFNMHLKTTFKLHLWSHYFKEPLWSLRNGSNLFLRNGSRMEGICCSQD